MRDEITGKMTNSDRCMYRPKDLLVDELIKQGSQCSDFESICKMTKDSEVNKTLLEFRPIQFPLRIPTNFFCTGKWIFEINKLDGYRDYKIRVFRTEPKLDE